MRTKQEIESEVWRIQEEINGLEKSLLEQAKCSNHEYMLRYQELMSKCRALQVQTAMRDVLKWALAPKGSRR